MKQNQKHETARCFIKNYISANDFFASYSSHNSALIKGFRSAWRSYRQDLEDRKEKEKVEKRMKYYGSTKLITKVLN